MKKPWSLSTTVRNPTRILAFLDTLKDMEGRYFNNTNQIHFQTLLIKNKLYVPNKLTDYEKKALNLEQGISFEMAKQIFDNQNYHDPAMRGRQSFAILKKMGLCIGSPKVSIKLTDFGNDMLDPLNDMGNLFFTYFIKWQLPNPIDTEFGETSGFFIKPFLGTLHLIREVNLLWEKEKNKPVGISKEEFSIFVPTLIHYKEIKNHAAKLIKFRKQTKKDKEIFKNNFAKNFLGDNDPKKIKNLFSNLKDYGDNAIRYFRLTRYIQIRGNGFYVDLEKRRMIEVLELLEFDDASPLEFTEKQYIEYLSDKTRPELPWNKEVVLLQILKYLNSEVSNTVKISNQSEIKMPKKPNLSGLSLSDEINLLKAYLLEIQKTKQYHDMSNNENILKCIKILRNIRNTGNKPSVELEKQISLALMALNDADKIKPNYPIGDDGEPTFTAPAGVSDIECYYDAFNLVCEVTLLSDRSQWYNEGQPVMRHLREFEKNNGDKISYCLFVAPKIHVDTVNTFWNAVKYEYRGSKQKIIPLTINMFIQLLFVLQKYKNLNNKIFSHNELMKLYDNIINLVETVETSDEWIKQIPNTINMWEKCILK